MEKRVRFAHLPCSKVTRTAHHHLNYNLDSFFLMLQVHKALQKVFRITLKVCTPLLLYIRSCKFSRAIQTTHYELSCFFRPYDLWRLPLPGTSIIIISLQKNEDASAGTMTFLPLIQDHSQQEALPDAALLLSDDNIDECLAMRITMDDPSNGCSLTYITQCFIRYVHITRGLLFGITMHDVFLLTSS